MAEERAVSQTRPSGRPARDLRRRIDELDELLVRLLSARAACALEIGREKKLLGLEIYQPAREAEVLAHVQQHQPGPAERRSDEAAVRADHRRGAGGSSGMRKLAEAVPSERLEAVR